MQVTDSIALGLAAPKGTRAAPEAAAGFAAVLQAASQPAMGARPAASPERLGITGASQGSPDEIAASPAEAMRFGLPENARSTTEGVDLTDVDDIAVDDEETFDDDVAIDDEQTLDDGQPRADQLDLGDPVSIDGPVVDDGAIVDTGSAIDGRFALDEALAFDERLALDDTVPRDTHVALDDALAIERGLALDDARAVDGGPAIDPDLAMADDRAGRDRGTIPRESSAHRAHGSDVNRDGASGAEASEAVDPLVDPGSDHVRGAAHATAAAAVGRSEAGLRDLQPEAIDVLARVDPATVSAAIAPAVTVAAASPKTTAPLHVRDGSRSSSAHARRAPHSPPMSAARIASPAPGGLTLAASELVGSEPGVPTALHNTSDPEGPDQAGRAPAGGAVEPLPSPSLALDRSTAGGGRSVPVLPDADMARRTARQEAATRVVDRLALQGDARATVDHPELGRLEIAARRQGGEVDVDLRARELSTVAVLRSAAPQLEQDLRSQSVELRHLDIDHQAEATDAEGRQRQPQHGPHDRHPSRPRRQGERGPSPTSTTQDDPAPMGTEPRAGVRVVL